MLTILRASVCLPHTCKMQYTHTKACIHICTHIPHIRVHHTQIHRYTQTYAHTYHTYPVHTHPTHTHTQHIHTPNTYTCCLCLSISVSLSVCLTHIYSYEKWLIRLVPAIISQYEHLSKDPVVHTACIHQSTSAKQGERPGRAVLRGTNHELTFAVCRLLGTSLAR